MLVSRLQCLNQPQEFWHISSCGERIIHNGTDDLVSINDEYGPGCFRIFSLRHNHSIFMGHILIQISNDRKFNFDIKLFFDIPYPCYMGVNTVNAQP